MKIKYTKELLETMRIFNAVTHISIKDCIDEGDVIFFVVNQGQIGKAVGKGGAHVKILQDKLKKKVKMVEFNSDKVRFVGNLIYPVKAEIVEENEKLVIKVNDRQSKGLIIGRNAKNLNMVKRLASRYFPIQEIVVQ